MQGHPNQPFPSGKIVASATATRHLKPPADLNTPLSEAVVDRIVDLDNDLDGDTRRSLFEAYKAGADERIKALASNSNLTASQERSLARNERIMERLMALTGVDRSQYNGVQQSEAPARRRKYERNQPLGPGQSFAGYDQVFNPQVITDEVTGGEASLSFGKYLRGAVTGHWADAGAEHFAFQNSMGGGSSSAGGVLIPSSLSAQVIDLARARTRVLEAGAQIVPMDSRQVVVPKWATDPTMGWRAEGDPIAVSDAALDSVTLTAKTLAVVTKVTRELIEDSDIEDELAKAFAASFALKLDKAALYGSGASNEPTGIKANANVVKTSLGTNGAVPSYDTLVDAVGALRDANEDPTAQIVADRTARTLAKLKDSQGQYLAAPAYLDDVPLLSTNQVPTNLTQGTWTTASDIFTGDFRELYIGVRTSLEITLLKERYMAEEGSYAFVAWWRGDIQVARPAAFNVTLGAKP